MCLDDSPALGEIHTFRQAVWAAHLGGHQTAWENPMREESLARLKEVTRGFQEVYRAEENLEGGVSGPHDGLPHPGQQ